MLRKLVTCRARMQSSTDNDIIATGKSTDKCGCRAHAFAASAFSPGGAKQPDTAMKGNVDIQNLEEGVGEMFEHGDAVKGEVIVTWSPPDGKVVTLEHSSLSGAAGCGAWIAELDVSTNFWLQLRL